MKRFITWLFMRFVYEPELHLERHQPGQQRRIIMFEPAPEWEAQIEKDITKPRLN